ncbi:hypothetical protein OQA88_12523 [Cercophora sp. LCS_1]
MTLAAFHFFSLLPPELRRKIYLLATTPRFVHIKTESLVELTEQQEEDDLSDFEAFAQSVAPWNLHVHPTLAYFAHGWRDAIRLPRPPSRPSWNFRPRAPESAIQTQLTSYGFTTTKERHLPWPPTEECPELPPHLLFTNPAAAWKMARPHRLYSEAPIPPLLHTCFESRQVLIQYGYQLAFATRSAPPATWFCFRDDVMYLSRVDHDWQSRYPSYQSSLYVDPEDDDVGVWDLDPRDLVRVRRLALERVRFSHGEISEASLMLRLCPNVEELFAVQVRLDTKILDYLGGRNGSSRHPNRYALRSDADERQPKADGGSVRPIWGWVGCDEADLAGQLDLTIGTERVTGIGLTCIRWEDTRIWHWKRQHGDTTGFFDEEARLIQGSLRQEQEAILQGVQLAQSKMGLWNIPTVKLAVLGTPASIGELHVARNRYWAALRQREEDEREQGVDPRDWMSV